MLWFPMSVHYTDAFVGTFPSGAASSPRMKDILAIMLRIFHLFSIH